MHRCLQTQDVVYHIANIALPDKHSLTAMARTCRAFYEPCMGPLWREIRSIDNFLDCFPEDLWEKDPNGQVRIRSLSWSGSQLECHLTNSASFVQRKLRRFPQSFKDWERPLRNAARIRTLFHTRTASAQKYDDDIFRTLAFTRPKLYIFPQLRTLVYQSGSHPLNFLLFLSPTLIKLDLVGFGSQERSALGSILESIACHSPRLEVLLLRTRFDIPTLPATPTPELRAVCFLQKLYHFGLASEMDLVGGLPALSTLPNLRFLVLLRCTIASTPKINQPLPFPTLRRLVLQDVQPIKAFVDILAAVSAPNLTHLTVSFTVDALPNTIFQGVFKVLSTYHSLRQIVFGVPPSTRLEETREIYNEAILEPLLQLKKLTELDLKYFSFDITDSMLGKIASRWPQISSLSLGCHSLNSTISATPKGLRAVSAGCRELQVLGVPVDFSQSQSSDPGSQVPPGHLCKELHVGRSIARDPIRVAACISGIFPAVKVHSQYQPPAEQSKKWDEVNSFIRPFVEVREEERTGMRAAGSSRTQTPDGSPDNSVQ